MARPVLRLKPKRPEGALGCPKCDGWLVYMINTDGYGCAKCDYREEPPAPDPAMAAFMAPLMFPWGHPRPREWIKGQLLNMRKSGESYFITALNEEFDPQHPERALVFDNSHDCQEWISWWYAMESHDPRAG